MVTSIIMKTYPIKWLSFLGELIPLILFFVGFNLSGLYLAATLSVTAGVIIFVAGFVGMVYFAQMFA